MSKYRKINTELNRQYRNDLNHNFDQIDEDIKSVGDKIENVIGSGFVSQLEDARDNANAAANNANSKASYANGRGKYANTQGSFAKNQGDYAKLKGDYADEKAILADQAAASANAEATNLDGLKVDVVDATQAANTAANNAKNKADFADDRGRYANTQGKRAENAVDAINNVVKDGPVLSVNGQVGLVEITSEDVNYLGSMYDEERTMNQYSIGISLERMTLSAENEFEGHTNGWVNVRTERNFNSSHGVQVATVYANGRVLRGVYTRISIGTNNTPKWSDWKQVILDNSYATEDSYGLVKPDGNSIISVNGVLSVNPYPKQTWLFKDGDTFDDLTGGFTPRAWGAPGGSAQITEKMNITIANDNGNRNYITKNPIDLSSTRILNVELNGQMASTSSVRLTVQLNSGNFYTGQATLIINEDISDKKVYTLDVSDLDGEYYIGIVCLKREESEEDLIANIYKIWGE